MVHYIRHLALITPYAHFELHFKTSREKCGAAAASGSRFGVVAHPALVAIPRPLPPLQEVAVARAAAPLDRHPAHAARGTVDWFYLGTIIVDAS